MSKLIKILASILVLAGLLTWGVSSLASSWHKSTITDQGIELKGQVMENGIEVSRDQIRVYGK